MAEPPKGQSCETCRYHYVSKGNVNRCRRYPPQIAEGANSFCVSVDPVAVDWCGEWAPTNPETVEEGAATMARLVLLGDLTAARALADKLRE
jgi:hypothetical protein